VPHATSRERRRRRLEEGVPFMTPTMRRRGSGPPQPNVKPVLSLGVRRLRGMQQHSDQRAARR
jgi:hypothetical protein